MNKYGPVRATTISYNNKDKNTKRIKHKIANNKLYLTTLTIKKSKILIVFNFEKSQQNICLNTQQKWWQIHRRK